MYLWKEHLSSLLSHPVCELIDHQVDTKLQFIKKKWRCLYLICVRVLFISVIAFSLSCVHSVYRVLISMNLSSRVDLICSALSGSGCWCILAALAQALAGLDIESVAPYFHSAIVMITLNTVLCVNKGWEERCGGDWMRFLGSLSRIWHHLHMETFIICFKGTSSLGHCS